MSDLMLCGVLRTPRERIVGDVIAEHQFFSRAKDAAFELEQRASRIAELEKQLEAARKDAPDTERYRWLLANIDDPEGLECPIGWLLFETDSKDWNNKIDAAIAASKPAKDGA